MTALWMLSSRSLRPTRLRGLTPKPGEKGLSDGVPRLLKPDMNGAGAAVGVGDWWLM